MKTWSKLNKNLILKQVYNNKVGEEEIIEKYDILFSSW